MTHGHGEDHFRNLDTAPGDEREEFELAAGVRGYLLGLFLATLLTAISFALPWTNLIWKPGIPVALVVFAIAQMGVHLVFFLHLTTSPDNTNNILALAFGVLIVFLIIGGSIWIMNNMNANMAPGMSGGEQMQMQAPMRH